MAQKKDAATKKYSRLACDLIRYHFGNKRIKIEPLTGGLTNFVFGATIGKDELVVRINEDRDKINFFLKEQWAVTRAKEHGIPVAEILEVGNAIIPVPYMILRRVKGVAATDHLERSETIREMGRYAAELHTIGTKSYGHVFDWSQNTLSKNETWKDYLNNEMEIDRRMKILRRYRMIPEARLARLNKAIGEIVKLDSSPCLHHGDLRLKNMMVDDKGKIVSIIDWDTCISSIPPYWDMSIALHDLSIDKQGLFLEGYGISAKKFSEMSDVVKVLNILNYAPVIEQLYTEKNRQMIELYRARLNGSLDLFTL